MWVSCNSLQLLKNIFVTTIFGHIPAFPHEIKAHKAILALKSPTFLSLFTLDMQEAGQNSATVDDCEEGVFRALLEYIYTNNVQDMDVHLALDLIPVAEKYLLLELKKVCGNFLSTKLTVENAAHVAAVAQHHSCAELLDQVYAFFAVNKQALLHNADWETFCKSNGEFTYNLLNKYSRRLCL